MQHSTQHQVHKSIKFKSTQQFSSTSSTSSLLPFSFVAIRALLLLLLSNIYMPSNPKRLKLLANLLLDDWVLSWLLILVCIRSKDIILGIFPLLPHLEAIALLLTRLWCIRDLRSVHLFMRMSLILVPLAISRLLLLAVLKRAVCSA